MLVMARVRSRLIWTESTNAREGIKTTHLPQNLQKY